MSTFVFPRQFYNDEVGRTLPLSRLYFYETGTYNDKQVFSDKALTTPMSQPVVADGSGRFPPIYLNTDTSYRVQLKDRLDQDIGTYIDGVEPYIYPSSLGTAAYVDTGTDAGDVPLNSDLGTASTLDAKTSVTSTTANQLINYDYFQYNQDFGIGKTLILKNLTGASVAPGSIIAGSSVDIVKITTGGLIQGAGSSGIIGSYRNAGGRTILSNEFGFFMRVV